MNIDLKKIADNYCAATGKLSRRIVLWLKLSTQI